jgi:hypothetical protein
VGSPFVHLSSSPMWIAASHEELSVPEWSSFVESGFDYVCTCPSLPAGEGAT